MNLKTLAAAAFLVVASAIPVASQTLTVSVTGSGKVTGTGIDCPSDCKEMLPQPPPPAPVKGTTVRSSGTVVPMVSVTVVLTAVGFSHTWGGACRGTTGSTCTVTVPPTGATVSAAFTTPAPPDMPSAFDSSSSAPNWGAVVSGPGTISSSPSGPVALGTVVTYRAQPNAGASFAQWTGSCTGTDPVCTRTFKEPFATTAQFGYPVTITIEGAPGRVTGMAIMAIDCPSVCTRLASGVVLLTASVPAPPGGGDAPVVFREWAGACAGDHLRKDGCTLFDIKGPTSVIARFAVKIPFP